MRAAIRFVLGSATPTRINNNPAAVILFQDELKDVVGVPSTSQQQQQQQHYQQNFRVYYTNTEAMKKQDPYAQLGLSWGATATEIKQAYKNLARQYHPDVNQKDSREQALVKFQAIQKAYQTLMGYRNGGFNNGDDYNDGDEVWSFAVWRKGDVIAQERTDVAGVRRKRPIQPAAAQQQGKNWGGIAALGHPDGKSGNSYRRRAEYLNAGAEAAGGEQQQRKKRSSTVGTGRSKWVQPKPFQEWNKQTNKTRRQQQQQQK